MYAAVNGFLDDVEVAKVRSFEAAFHGFMESNHPGILKEIEEKKIIEPDNEAKLKDAIQEFKKSVPY